MGLLALCFWSTCSTCRLLIDAHRAPCSLPCEALRASMGVGRGRFCCCSRRHCALGVPDGAVDAARRDGFLSVSACAGVRRAVSMGFRGWRVGLGWLHLGPASPHAQSVCVGWRRHAPSDDGLAVGVAASLARYRCLASEVGLAGATQRAISLAPAALCGIFARCTRAVERAHRVLSLLLSSIQ